MVGPGLFQGFSLAVKYLTMITIQCITLFDITASGIRNNYKPYIQETYDQEGVLINSKEAWQKSRNQHRNWETINQIMALRTLPENITRPVCQDNKWTFEFSIPNASAFQTSNDQLGLLKQDTNGVPMIVGLNEIEKIVPYFVVDGAHTNTWFSVV